MDIAYKMLMTFNDASNLLKKFITSDESLAYAYDIETKVQSSQWKRSEELRSKKVPQVRSNVKVLLTVFFEYNGVMHHKFAPQDCTVNKENYLEVICQLREKRTDFWKN